MQTFQFCRYLQEAPGEHTYLPKKTGIFPVEIVRNHDVFVLQNKAWGDIFGGKGISE